MKKLAEYLASRAVIYSPTETGIVPWEVQVEAARKFSLTFAQVEETALREGLLPARYRRNRTTIPRDQQLRLFQGSAAVVGCGGLGGYIIEELARLGVGHLTIMDFDHFEEHNLNRQLFCSMETLGQSKVSAAVERVKTINPAVTVVGLNERFNRKNGPELLSGVQVVVDALDGIPIRLELAEVCEQLKVPLVHGAIAGWYGQVMTQFPGENYLNFVYGKSVGDKGKERELGIISFSPAVVASLQAAEVCKLLLQQGSPLRGRILHIDLLEMEFEEVHLD